MANNLTTHFCKEDKQMANKQEKTMNIWVIGETQITTTVKHHFTPTRTALMK